MREILEAIAAGELSPAEAEAALRGYAETSAGRFDAARETRTGIPEAVLADGKSPAETAAMVQTSVETTGRAIATRVDDEAATACGERLAAAGLDVTVDRDERARTLVVHATDFEPPDIDATVGIVTAGTADAHAAGEAAVVASEMGATVERFDDVGVAGIHRLVDRLDELRATDVIVVAAGREGALPTVVAGLVDVPVIGLPTAIGYGYGGGGEAALAGMLQSCVPLSVVNIDAGFPAGAQAGVIARTIADARDRSE